MQVSAVRGIGLLVVLCSQLAFAFQKDVRLVYDRPEETGYKGEVQSSPAFFGTARVELELDVRGVAYAVSAPAGLPDDVVRSLSHWRLEPAKKNGHYAPFQVVMMVPLTSPLKSASDGIVRRVFDRELRDAEPVRLVSADPNATEKITPADDRQWTGFVRLLTDALEGAVGAPEEARRIRARLILSLVEDHPDAPVLATPLAMIQPSGGLLADADTHQKVRELWLTRLGRTSTSGAILKHAVNFLRISDPIACERRLVAESNINDAPGQWLGEVYGLALLGVTELDPKSGMASAAGAGMPDDAFAKHAAEVLGSTSSARVVLSAMQTVMAGAHSLAVAGKLPAGYAPVCDAVLVRAKQLSPATAATCDTSIAVPEPAH